jgi:RecA-family ATPase
MTSTWAGAEEFKRRAEEGQVKPNGTVKPLPFTLLRDLEAALDYNDIVRDLIPRGGLGEVHAAPGAGKSAIILDLVLHVADGRDYRGRRTERQPVVYVALEGHRGIGNRVVAAAAHLNVEDAPLALVRATENYRDSEAAERTAATARELMRLFGGDCPIIVLDTFTSALGAGGSDCRPEDVSAFIEHIKMHMIAHGFTVIVVHHVGKDASRGGRGWSGLNAALDFELEIDRDGDLRTMRVTKSRDGSDMQGAFCYELESRALGTNQHGEAVTPLWCATSRTRPRPRRAGASARRPALRSTSCGR